MGESSLKETCASGNYNFVILESLDIFDNGTNSKLHFLHHNTDQQSNILYCQSQNVAVLLSITRFSNIQFKSLGSSKSNDVTEDVAEYIYNNFLGGDVSTPGPLGNVVLDGIDFSNSEDLEKIKWVDLLKAIDKRRKQSKRKIYLSASPLSTSSLLLDEAINTKLFDYLFVRFYYGGLSMLLYNNNNYKYNNDDGNENGDTNSILEKWKTWTDRVPNSKVFMGLVAKDHVVRSGYVEPTTLKDEILPVIKQTSNYGGVMIANRYYDQETDYSGEIMDSVPINKICTCTCDEIAMSSNKFYGLLRQF